MKLLEKLEEFKQCGMYNVMFWYGEEVGCDDSDITSIDNGILH